MEADRYQHLKLLQRAGIISELETHPEFVLIEPFKKFGKKKRGHKYKADFMYRDFPLRRTLFDSKYPDIVLKVVTKDGSRWEEM